MSGTVIRLLEETVYDFMNVAVGHDFTFIVAQHVDTSGFREGTLIVRVVSTNFQDYATSDDVQIVAENDGWDPAGGTTLFQPLGEYATLVAATTLNPTGVGAQPPSSAYVMYFPLAANFGPMIAVALKAVRGATSNQTHALQIQLVIDLALKD